MSDNNRIRMLVLWCPDWPVVAACAAEATPPDRPAAVFSANRVVACSALARADGVRRGMRRREAQSRCPELVVFGAEPERDARFFEAVAVAVEELVVGVEVVRPGIVAMPVAGAAGYFGGEARLAELLVDQVAAQVGVECQVGIADGLFAATLAAHRSALVEAGGTANFLAPLDIRVLDQPGADRAELVDLLRRLGLRTLGAFAALTTREVLSRFGADGEIAHRLASGRSERPPVRRRPPPELTVTKECDPPLDRVDVAAFTAKTMAAGFQAGLAAWGLACTRLGVHAVTENGEEMSRIWRCAEPLDEQGVADRVRWQFEGWLKGRTGRPTAGVVRLQLVPEETVEGRSLQLGLIGTEQQLADERAAQAMVHVQGLLGPEAVLTPVLDGGRGPAERVRLVPWGDRRVPARLPEARWDGRLPMPATVFPEPLPARVFDAGGTEVGITERYQLSGPPAAVAVDGGDARPVRGWSGPWQARGRGTDQVRLQVVLDGTSALLLVRTLDNPKWTVEGEYGW
ncbi:DNA polymerase Y family protein [Amycolatopsis sp. 195334CR]|uniref:DNA polymerase Y family protein n=1 Tax=Amycolatopsis sp. 195334CR TaxID=2814588 RepID=UPI001F5C1CEE|nr:DNA polymerase Y family protein [Amycolatopsis sp. 195334CR]